MNRPTDQNRPPPTLEAGALPWLLSVVAATCAPHLVHLPPWLSLSAVALLLWHIWRWHYAVALPPRWIRLALAIAGMAGIVLQYRTLLGRDAGVALIVFFMALKPLEMRLQRDAMVIVMLGYFLLLTHYFYAQGIPTGLWLIAASTLVTAALIRVHGGAQTPHVILRQAATMLMQALPFMLLGFVLFPRINGPLWGLPQDAHAGLSGLSERMAPGSLSELIQSGEIAFRVQFIGEGRQVLPDQSALYWRGPVFNEYDGQTWFAARGAEDYRAAEQARQAPTLEVRGRAYHYVITLEAHNQRWLLPLDLPVSRPPDTVLTPTLETLSRERIAQRARYAFTSHVDFTVNREEDERRLKQALILPPIRNPRTRALAAEWRTRYDTPQLISDAALRLFGGGGYSYTLQPPLLGRDAIDDFLFDTRRGFCEHYATAYVFLMRAAGVPARVVAGYQGGELNPVDGYLTVRQSDAHAWAEIWIAGRGWLRVDPTAAVAPSRIESGIEAALPAGEPLPALVRLDNDWLRAMRDRWEAVNNAWNQWVLGYNPQRQQEVWSQIGSWFGLEAPDWRDMTVALSVLSALALAALAGWTLRQQRTRTPAQRVWLACCRRLAAQGLPRHAWEGPLAYAQRVGQARPDLSALVDEMARLFIELHYGRGGTPQLRQLETCRRRLKPPPPWRKHS